MHVGEGGVEVHWWCVGRGKKCEYVRLAIFDLCTWIFQLFFKEALGSKIVQLSTARQHKQKIVSTV